MRVTSNDTRAAILTAMGFDVPDEAAAQRALDRLDDERREQLLEPVRVVQRRSGTIEFRVPAAWNVPVSAPVDYAVTLQRERGDVTTHDGTCAQDTARMATIPLPADIPFGYHDLHLRIHAAGHDGEARQRLIVTPSSCRLPARRAFGITANVYSLRSANNFGIGTLNDLAVLAEWSARQGAAFVGVNPLHALRNHGYDISPYRPLSRIYRNVLYLDIEAIPELAECDEARALLAHEVVRVELAELRASSRVLYDRIAAIERLALDALYRTFARGHLSGDTARGMAYARYVQREGEPLRRFALHRALEEQFSPHGGAIVAWRNWPAPFRDPRSSEVAAFAKEHAHAVEFHQWEQFELDRQLAEADRRGAAAGLSIGLYQDLAIGSAQDGADAWSHQHLFLNGVSIGAPPDDYAEAGQNWGIPPIGPRRLRDDRYEYWIAIIRSALRHSGALRVDHVLGLFRQFWIPDGMAGADGAYVRFPTTDLLGILALESTRQHAVIVGEDLGTVPPEVPGTLRQWGVLSSRVMLFEREPNGDFHSAASYEPLSLATADTHDMAPLEGYWRGRDLELRAELGMTAPNAVDDARAARERERAGLKARLLEDGALDAAAAAAGVELGGTQLRCAVHRFLCRTPARLVGLELDDLTGEVEPVNVPGIPPERFPSWTRRMMTPLESLSGNVEVAATLCCDRAPEPF